MSRAAWLTEATPRVIDIARRTSWPDDIKISVGPMIHTDPSLSVGEAWMETRHLGRVNIAPTLVGVEALTVLLHELLHLSVGPHRMHARPFTRAARIAGLEAPYAVSNAGPGLLRELTRLYTALGPYPPN